MEKKNINNIVQEKLKKIEDTIVPGTNWDKASSWKKIREILDTKNKKMVIWYFATAASISFAFAATLNENLNFVKHSIDEIISKPIVETADSQLIIDNQKIIEPVKKESEVIITKNPIVELSDFTETVSPKPQFVPFENILEPESNVTSQPKRIRLTPSASLNGVANANLWNNLVPGIGVDFRYQINDDISSRKYISLGLQSSMFTKFETEGQSKVYPATFVTTKYSQSRVNLNGKKKIWEVGAGYLVNPDHEIFDDSTFKVQYNRTIMGRLRGGPELIFTNKFRKVYPGFTIVFS